MQIHKLTTDLVTLSLSVDQCYPSERQVMQRITELSVTNLDLSLTLKNIPYSELYSELISLRHYNIKMIDGALIQMLYRFQNNSIVSHRLAFFPCPNLPEYQNHYEEYDSDSLYLEIHRKSLVKFPIRFDFDVDNKKDVIHPASHLTLGQYKNCRIPASAALTPYNFISFLIRNFYNTPDTDYSSKITSFTEYFPDTITNSERKIVHIQLPY